MQQFISHRFGVLTPASSLCNPSQAIAKESDVFLWELMGRFLNVLEGIPEVGDVNKDQIEFCERFLELLIDLEVCTHASSSAKRVLAGCSCGGCLCPARGAHLSD